MVVVRSGGNLAILAGSSKQKPVSFLVDRYAMIAASPVWKTMLDPQGPFIEAYSTNCSFPGDDPASLLVLLAIAHLRVDKLPTLADNKIVSVLELADKYDMLGPLTPFLTKFRINQFAENISRKNPQGLKAAYILGMESCAQKWIRTIASSCRQDRGGLSVGGYFEDPSSFEAPDKSVEGTATSR